jgi:phosphoglycerate dehydrogenase-like enzyme
VSGRAGDRLNMVVNWASVSDEHIAAIESIDPAVRVVRCDFADLPGLPVPPEPSAAQQDVLHHAEVLLTIRLPQPIARYAPRLRWIQSVGAGVEQFINDDVRDAHIKVTSAAGASSEGVAEFVMARVLEHLKLLDVYRSMQLRREWHHQFGARVAGRTMLIVGFGSIGRQVAKRARAFGMHVVATRRSSPIDTADVDEVVAATNLLHALGRADVVVCAATGGPENNNLFDTEAFAATKRGALFVNVSRGRLVDEDALVAALVSGQLAAAALDVTRQEPLPADSPLWEVPNLRLSPHSSSTQEGYPDRVIAILCENVRRYLRGEPLLNDCTPT